MMNAYNPGAVIEDDAKKHSGARNGSVLEGYCFRIELSLICRLHL